jgi:negative regulator of flagellin synthesis FlgM
VKINSSVPSVGSTPEPSRPRSPQALASKADAGSSERVDISSLSAQLQEVGAGDTAMNSARVAEIKQAISEGRFQINPERIADGLLSSVRDMLGRAKPAA